MVYVAKNSKIFITIYLIIVVDALYEHQIDTITQAQAFKRKYQIEQWHQQTRVTHFSGFWCYFYLHGLLPSLLLFSL